MKFLMKFYVVLFIVSFLFVSCDNETVNPVNPNIPQNGALILNEGPFGSGFGTIDFYSRETGDVTRSVYRAYNTESVLGNIVQSACITENAIYVVVNNSNKVVVIDPLTFRKKNEIRNLHLPRYMVVKGDRGYISQWGDDGVTGSIAIVDLKKYLVLETIEMGSGPERLFVDGGKLYIPRSGGYGRDSIITILDLTDNLIVKSIVVGDNPRGIVKDKNGSLWATASGYSDWINPENSTNGKLVKIENDEVISSQDIANGALAPFPSENGDFIYFLDNAFYGQGIFKVDISNPQIDEPFIPYTYYNMSIDPRNGDVFCCDAKDYSSEGEVVIYDKFGDEKSRLSVGVIPHNIYFID